MQPLLPEFRELSRSVPAGIDVGDINAQRDSQVDLMVLLIDEDVANLLGHGEFSEQFALADAIPVIAHRLIFIFEIGAEHLVVFAAEFDGPGLDGWRSTQIVDLPRDGSRMLELLGGMLFELRSDVHIRGSLEDLGIHHVSDDGLVFARKVFIQSFDELFAGERFGCWIRQSCGAMGHGVLLCRFDVWRASKVQLRGKDGLPDCFFRIESESNTAYWDFAVSRETGQRKNGRETANRPRFISARSFERGFSPYFRQGR